MASVRIAELLAPVRHNWTYASVFPLYLHFGRYRVHPHLFFEVLSYIVGFRLYLFLRRRFGDPILTTLRWAAIAAAVAGAALGAKLLFWFEDPSQTLRHIHDPAYLLGGKTIVGALLFGLLTVELLKRYIGLQQSTGDLYAIPLALGIAIGRIGCFLTGLSDNTYGTPTSLPWGIDFGDGIRRHPTQLYEIIFLLLLIPILYRLLQRIVALTGSGASASTAMTPIVLRRPLSTHYPVGGALRPGDAFKVFMVAYMSFRLLVDFFKPYPRLFLGLGGIQLACIAVLLYYSRDIARWLRIAPARIRSDMQPPRSSLVRPDRY